MEIREVTKRRDSESLSKWRCMKRKKRQWRKITREVVVEKMCGFRHTLQVKARTSWSRRHTKTGRVSFSTWRN
jgi:hypothetical protein